MSLLGQSFLGGRALVPAEPPLVPDNGEARRWAVEELSRPVYRNAEPSWVAGLWQQFMDWLRSLNSNEIGLEGNVAAPLIGVAIAVLIGVAVVLIRPRRNPRRKLQSDIFDVGIPVSAGEYRERAAAAAARGDWPAAVLDQFRALVRSAEDRAVIDPQAGRTANEVAGQLSLAFGAAAGKLHAAALIFDAVRYGRAGADQLDFDAIAGLDRSLMLMSPDYDEAATLGLAVPR